MKKLLLSLFALATLVPASNLMAMQKEQKIRVWAHFKNASVPAVLVASRTPERAIEGPNYELTLLAKGRGSWDSKNFGKGFVATTKGLFTVEVQDESIVLSHYDQTTAQAVEINRISLNDKRAIATSNDLSMFGILISKEGDVTLIPGTEI